LGLTSRTCQVHRLTFYLIRHSLFILCGALEQQFIGIKHPICAQLTGHDSLGFIAQQVGFGTNIDHCDTCAGRVGDCSVQYFRQSTLGFDVRIVTRHMGGFESVRVCGSYWIVSPITAPEMRRLFPTALSPAAFNSSMVMKYSALACVEDTMR
jgi:hypothetical protein